MTKQNNQHMKSMFFFDDWLLFAREGLDRMQGQPKHVKELRLETTPDPHIKMIRACSMNYDQNKGCYVLYVECFDQEDNRCMSRLESEDPYNWPPLGITPGNGPIWTRAQNVMVDQHGKPISCVDIVPLGGTPLAEKGYVANFYDYGEKHRGNYTEDIPSAAIGFSQDGVHFEVDENTHWIPHHSDTGNHPFYNPNSGEYVIPCRTEQSDRRVAFVTTTDFKTFSRPKMVLQPDAEDPINREFYGMGVTSCEDMFVGYLGIYDAEPTEKAHCKFQGTNQMQLTYSYDGDCWNRASREMIIPRSEPGTAMGGCVYAGPPVRTPDNRLLGLVMSCWGDHSSYRDDGVPKELVRSFWVASLFDMRMDEYAFLRTRARHGRIMTKCVLPQGGDLTVNTRTTHTGYVKAVVLDAETFEPVPNYTLEDAIPVTGDEVFGVLHWRERNNLDELKDRRILLELHVREADVFALRFGYRIHLGEYPHDRV